MRSITELAGGLRPLDAELNLPPELHSLLLRRRIAELSMDGSYEVAGSKLRR